MGKPALVGLLVAVLWVTGGCGRQKSEVVARVNERPITKEQLWEALERGENGEAGRRALDALIVRQLVRQEAQKRGIKVSPEEVQVRLEGLKDYVLAGAGKDFASWLEDSGLTEEYLTDRLSLQILTSKLVIPDRDRKEYFETNKERLKELPHNNESVIYRQIVVATKAEAEALHKELATSETADFAKIAGDKSLDPMTRTRGGMMGWAVKGKMSPSDQELEKVLFSLKAGEISQPVPLRSATEPPPDRAEGEQQPEMWRIVKVEKHIPPHEITLEGNADVIEEWMMSDPQFQRPLQEFFDNLRASAKVEFLDPRYRSLDKAYEKRRQMQQRMVSPTPVPAMPGAPGGTARQGGRAPGPEAPRRPAVGEKRSG